MTLPFNLASLDAHPNPALDYADALRRVAAIQAQEVAGYNPLCQTQLLTHGHPTARALAFLHGYTNCPDQFRQLGQQLYDRGYNVLLAPAPRHGLADGMTTELSGLTAEELVVYTDQMVDILGGLGEHTSVGGLSQGGLLAAWAAHTRADLDQAVLISPSFGLKAIPPAATALAARVGLALPEFYLWWDSLVRLDPRPPPPTGVQGYPRFSVHGLAQLLRLSLAVQALARARPPLARSLVVVTNAADLAVNNQLTAQWVAAWRAQGAAHVTHYEFPWHLRLDHDLIDPGLANQQVGLVYPKLLELIDGR